MKYFTKYLPVEGEIKEGDMFEYIWRDKPHYAKYDRAFPEFKGEKKVKLFLCSRDIQVGDKPIYMFDHRLHTVSGITQFMIDDELEKFKLYKVIGEVSPNAVWVKEGMEFEEDQIGIYDVNTRPDIEVNFKCPTCNTFH